MGAEPQHDVFRIWGANRYETAAEVSAARFVSSHSVVIARGDDAGSFADALAASVLAGVLECPILLTRPDRLSEAVIHEITRLGAGKAYVLGGEAAVTNDVAEALEDMGLQVERIAGDNRYETAAAVAEAARSLGDIADFAFVVNGLATADALVSGAFAYGSRVPVLLVRSDRIPQVTMDALESLGVQRVVIVGGTGVVGSEVEDELNLEICQVERLGGANRYATSTLFAAGMFEGLEHVALVRGDNANLADGISAAALGLPIIYVRHTFMSTTVEEYLEGALSGFSRVFAIGGMVAIDDRVLDRVEEIILDIPPMISLASIEDSTSGLVIHGDVDNVNNTVTLGIPPGFQFDGGYTLLSKPVRITVENTEGGMYDIAPPGITVRPDDDYVGIILSIFTDSGEPGAGSAKLLANDGTRVTLTDINDCTQSRTYTLNIVEDPRPLVTYAFIEDESRGITVNAWVDNHRDVISLTVPEGLQFTNGDTNLSMPVYVTVSNTEDGMYDIPAPGVRADPGDDYVDIILSLFSDLGEPGAGSAKLLANDGTRITLTDAGNPHNYRTYTLCIKAAP